MLGVQVLSYKRQPLDKTLNFTNPFLCVDPIHIPKTYVRWSSAFTPCTISFYLYKWLQGSLPEEQVLPKDWQLMAVTH